MIFDQSWIPTKVHPRQKSEISVSHQQGHEYHEPPERPAWCLGRTQKIQWLGGSDKRSHQEFPNHILVLDCLLRVPSSSIEVTILHAFATFMTLRTTNPSQSILGGHDVPTSDCDIEALFHVMALYRIDEIFLARNPRFLAMFDDTVSGICP